MTSPTNTMRVIVAEDEALISEFIQVVLEDSDRCRVVGCAETGREALELAATARPDVALVDISLRGPMDGLELAGRLRELDPAILIVFATGSHDPATRARTDAFGPAAVLHKPFLPNHLLQLMERLGR